MSTPAAEFKGDASDRTKGCCCGDAEEPRRCRGNHKPEKHSTDCGIKARDMTKYVMNKGLQENMVIGEQSASRWWSLKILDTESERKMRMRRAETALSHVT